MTLIHPHQYQVVSASVQYGIDLTTKCPFCKSGAKFRPRWKSSVNPDAIQQKNVPCSSCFKDVAFFLVMPNAILPNLAKTSNQFYMYPHPSTEVISPVLKGEEQIPPAIRGYYTKVVQAEALGDAHTAISNCRLALEGIVKEQLNLLDTKKKLFDLIEDLMEREIPNDNLANLSHALREASNRVHHYSQNGPQNEMAEIKDVANATAAVIEFFYSVPLLTKRIKAGGDNNPTL